MKISKLFAGAAALITVSALAAQPASAGMRVIDGTLAACSFEQTFGSIPSDGALEVQITDWNLGDFPDCADVADPANRAPFSINLFGQTYSTVFVNENGILSFGAPVTDAPGTPLDTLAVPAFAPFFANIAAPDANALRIGYELGPTAMWFNWIVEEEGGGAAVNDFQLAIRAVGNAGDFDLIFNYIAIGWDPGQAGFTDGNGNAYVLPGANVAGAYIGEDDEGLDPFGPNCGPLSIACLIGIDPELFGFAEDTGLYVFQFRDGVPVNVAFGEIPLPAAPFLFVTGLAAISAARRRRRS